MIDGMLVVPNNPTAMMQRDIAMGRIPAQPAPSPAPAATTARKDSSNDLSGFLPVGLGIGVAGLALAGLLIVMRNSA